MYVWGSWLIGNRKLKGDITIATLISTLSGVLYFENVWNIISSRYKYFLMHNSISNLMLLLFFHFILADALNEGESDLLPTFNMKEPLNKALGKYVWYFQNTIKVCKTYFFGYIFLSLDNYQNCFKVTVNAVVLCQSKCNAHDVIKIVSGTWKFLKMSIMISFSFTIQ